MKDCLICERVSLVNDHKSPYVVSDDADMAWVLADNQFYRGYSILLYKHHTENLHELSNIAAVQFLEQMYTIGNALFQKLHPVRINYEVLGNTDHHLHAHIIPRYADDPNPTQPIWTTNHHKQKLFTATDEELNVIRKELVW